MSARIECRSLEQKRRDLTCLSRFVLRCGFKKDELAFQVFIFLPVLPPHLHLSMQTKKFAKMFLHPVKHANIKIL